MGYNTYLCLVWCRLPPLDGDMAVCLVLTIDVYGFDQRLNEETGECKFVIEKLCTDEVVCFNKSVFLNVANLGLFFALFSSFSHNSNINWKELWYCSWDSNPSRRMVGADGSTELGMVVTTFLRVFLNDKERERKSRQIVFDLIAFVSDTFPYFFLYFSQFFSLTKR